MKKFDKFNIVLIILLFLGLFVIVFYFINFHGGLSNEQSIWAYFGDYLAGIFASFGFIVLLYTLYLQSKDSLLTSQNLKESNELNKSMALIEKENLDLKKREYKRSEIVQIFEVIEKDIYRNLDIVDQSYMENAKNFSGLFNELSKYLEKLKKVDPESVLIEYYKLKYKNLALHKNIIENLNEETKKYFQS